MSENLYTDKDVAWTYSDMVLPSIAPNIIDRACEQVLRKIGTLTKLIIKRQLEFLEYAMRKEILVNEKLTGLNICEPWVTAIKTFVGFERIDDRVGW